MQILQKKLRKIANALQTNGLLNKHMRHSNVKTTNIQATANIINYKTNRQTGQHQLNNSNRAEIQKSKTPQT